MFIAILKSKQTISKQNFQLSGETISTLSVAVKGSLQGEGEWFRLCSETVCIWSELTIDEASDVSEGWVEYVVAAVSSDGRIHKANSAAPVGIDLEYQMMILINPGRCRRYCARS